MIKIKLSQNSKTFLTPQQIADCANIFTPGKHPFTAWDYDEKNPKHCFLGLCDACEDPDAVFVIMESDEELKKIGLNNYWEHGGKRWIRCLNCGAISHL